MSRSRQDSEGERKRLPTREQIEVIRDLDSLKSLQDDLNRSRHQTEVDLEYWSEGDEEWERRARGYLTAVRIAIGNVSKQIHRVAVVSPRERQRQEVEESKNAKAARRLAHEAEARNSLERKKREQEALILRESSSRRKLIERVDYFHHWHRVAHELLTEDQCRQISSLAAQAQHQEIEKSLVVDS